MKAFIFDSTKLDEGSKYRGGGRFLSLLKEYLSDNFTFTSSLSDISYEDTLIIPFFNPFSPPFLKKRICKNQIMVILDAIPLKYSYAFPVGLKGKLNVLRNKINLKTYDRIITISEDAKDGIVKYLNVPKNKIEVIYLTLPSLFTSHSQNSLSKDYNLPSQYLIYVADVNWNKNIVNTAKAIKKAGIPCIFVGKVFEDLTLNFAHPWQKDLKEFIQETKNNPLFIFLGYVPNDDLVILYKNAYANILVSRDEGFGLSFLEAASQKTASILSDKPIFHEIAEDSALFAKAENPEDIAEKIKQLNDKSFRQDLQEKAFKRSTFFSKEKFKEQWAKLLY